MEVKNFRDLNILTMAYLIYLKKRSDVHNKPFLQKIRHTENFNFSDSLKVYLMWFATLI